MNVRYRVLTGLFTLSTITYLDRVCMNVVSKHVKADLNSTISSLAGFWVHFP